MFDLEFNLSESLQEALEVKLNGFEDLLCAVDEYITYRTHGKLEDLIRVRQKISKDIENAGNRE